MSVAGKDSPSSAATLTVVSGQPSNLQPYLGIKQNPAYRRMASTDPTTRASGNYVQFDNVSPAADGSLGRFSVRTFLALEQYRNVTGIAPRGSGVNAALRSLAQRPR